MEHECTIFILRFSGNAMCAICDALTVLQSAIQMEVSNMYIADKMLDNMYA